MVISIIRGYDIPTINRHVIYNVSYINFIELFYRITNDTIRESGGSTYSRKVGRK